MMHDCHMVPTTGPILAARHDIDDNLIDRLTAICKKQCVGNMPIRR